LNHRLGISRDLTHDECANILAALRLFQAIVEGKAAFQITNYKRVPNAWNMMSNAESVRTSMEHFEDARLLNGQQLDQLCESINLEETEEDKPPTNKERAQVKLTDDEQTQLVTAMRSAAIALAELWDTLRDIEGAHECEINLDLEAISDLATACNVPPTHGDLKTDYVLATYERHAQVNK